MGESSLCLSSAQGWLAASLRLGQMGRLGLAARCGGEVQAGRSGSEATLFLLNAQSTKATGAIYLRHGKRLETQGGISMGAAEQPWLEFSGPSVILRPLGGP